MKMTRIFALTAAALLLGGFDALGQSYYEYKFVFAGMAYQTNGSGDIVGTPITDQTLLQSQAQVLNITNLGTISLVYHFDGGPQGDTVDVISNATGETLTYQIGFYFGSDLSLGRYAVTNAAQTEQRRVDQIYTFDNTLYAYGGTGHAIGAAFTCKRFLTDTNGNTYSIVEGTLSWDVTPTGTNVAPVVCVGNFTLGQPMF
jgi:hypothetical protein